MLLQHCILLAAICYASAWASPLEIRATVIHDRPHHEIRSGGVTWVYDDAGGGFARLIDADGRDWINFRPEPLSEFPASAAAGFRGLGNLVHGGVDGGVGHPGYNHCTTEFEPPATLRTRSHSGEWEFTWTFADDQVEFSMLKAPPDRRWWFLYEGNPHGHFDPAGHEWGEPGQSPREERPSISSQWREAVRSVWFGHRESRFRLILTHETTTLFTANLWWMGAEARGQWRESRDGMLVFGFGRGAATEGPLLQGPQRFTVRLAPVSSSP